MRTSISQFKIRMALTEEKEDHRALDLTSFEIDELLGLFIGILSEKAWQYMGLRLTPGKKETVKDLKKAQSAIDCLIFLTDKLAPSLTPEDTNKLRSMIADIQLNYVKQS